MISIQPRSRTRQHGFAIVAWCIGIFLTTQIYSANLYVDASKSGGNGEKESPLKTIGAALAACHDGDTIRVAAGVYPEKVLLLKNGVRLRGGYNANFRDPRAPQDNETVIDGQNNFRPLQVGNETSGAVKFQVDGFVIRHGLAEGTEGASGKGGGLLVVNNSSGKIICCRFVDNKAMDDGGGIESETNGTLKIDRCFFGNNSAADDGGAIRLQNSHSTTTLTNCVFVNNSGLDKYVVQAKGNVKILNCTFVQNTSADRGIIASRSKADAPDQAVAVTNCIFAKNTAERRHPLLFADTGNVPIKCSNCLFFQNKATGGLGVQIGSGGNLEADPMFVDSDKNDFRLKAGSPAIDHGAAVDTIKKDYAGQGRSLGSAVDIGAFEFASSSATTETSK